MTDLWIEPPRRVLNNPIEQRIWKIMTYGGCSYEQAKEKSRRFRSDLKGAINEARTENNKKPWNPPRQYNECDFEDINCASGYSKPELIFEKIID